MCSAFQDSCQWLSVTEDTIFLHDGLIRVTDLVELPHAVNSTQERENEVITFDVRSPKELSERLQAVCGTQNNAFAKLLEYRLNALCGYWNAQRQGLGGDDQGDKEGAVGQDETLALLKKQGLYKEPEQAPFSTRISVLLVIPLLQSQSRFDPNLCRVTAGLLLNCLRECPPLSLLKEPGDCLKGLENLLCAWLGEEETKEGELTPSQDKSQRETAAAALVALACARGHLKTFIHAVHLLQILPELKELPVADVLNKLLATEGGQGQCSGLMGSKHVLCWGLEDMLNLTESPNSSAADKENKADSDIGRSIACDGVFLYTTNSQGFGMAKIGTGLHGSLRGYGYNRNLDVGPGKIAHGDEVLLYRPQNYDTDVNLTNLCCVMDSNSLQLVRTVPKPEAYLHEGPQATVAFCGDGQRFFWIWCPALASDKSVKGLNVYMEVFSYDVKENKAIPLQPRVILVKKDEANAKALNESLLSRFSFRASRPAASLIALTGNPEGTPGRKDESAYLAGSTTCGINFKTLLRTPVYCDGSTVIMVTSSSGGTTSASASRSLFGSLPTYRVLATNQCFQVKDGHFLSRVELTDAPSCALGRGAPILGLGTCFDARNNSVWVCSTDWVDQFYNPGHQAAHHLYDRLHVVQPLCPHGEPLTPGDDQRPMERELASPCTFPESQPSVDRQMPTEQVVQQLLQHVGCMCLHQMNSELLLSPFGALLGPSQGADLQHLSRVCHILKRSLDAKDHQGIICTLIVLQLLFKISIFKNNSKEEKELLQKISTLVWQQISTDKAAVGQPLETVTREACLTIVAGLHVLYPTSQEKFNLLKELLTNGMNKAALQTLRDMILVDISEKLRSPSLSKEEAKDLCLSPDIVQFILRLTVKESYSLLQQALIMDVQKYEDSLASVPVASPCLRYMSALQCYLLREAVSVKDAESQGEQADTSPSQQKLQQHMVELSSYIFDGAIEVLQMLLDVCNSMVDMFRDNLEERMQGLEKLSKATILGHLLPVLLTSLTHPRVRWLPLADGLMPKLVSLVLLSSQIALLMKGQSGSQSIEEEDDQGDDALMDVADLIGQAGYNDGQEIKEEEEEEGFLAGLKIPAPWASGKTIESIHPVRDNYKFKETVHIPGARCLYLRFDPRCSSQYDYDKLMVYAGSTTGSKKVAEYGGNTYGYGSRSVLGSGWPKDLVKVEGDTVTFSFEMRSGREHNTPDKAMWGFQVSVRAQESNEEVAGGLPFIADLALGLSVLACTMLQLLYCGPKKSIQEANCEHLLKTKLLQRCRWQTTSGGALKLIPSQPQEDSKKQLARIRLPADVLSSLRMLSKRHGVHIRQSIKEVVRPQELEEKIVSAVIKHLSFEDTVSQLPTLTEDSQELQFLSIVMEETYRRLDILVRQLQSVAELEQRWYSDIQEHREERSAQTPFFHDYHLQEGKTKELALLCFIQNVTFDPQNLEETVKMMRAKFEEEVKATETVTKEKSMRQTEHINQSVQSRLDLLLQVNIASEDSGQLNRALSHVGDRIPGPDCMTKSEISLPTGSAQLTRSISAPTSVDAEEAVLNLLRMPRGRLVHKRTGSYSSQDLTEDEGKGRAPYFILLQELFSFIGADPENSISSQDFLSAAQTRWKRGSTRKQALLHMKELLTAAAKVGGATHLVAAVTAVLQHGPCVQELTCGGMVTQVREAFSETMTSVVQLAARYPMACCNSIGLLCIIPYTRAEEKCLVRSGLLSLLDKLCSLASLRGENSETQSTKQKVSTMAWAGFQVLANRCVSWETQEGPLENLEHSGLARQVSQLLTNHLARATECVGNEAAGTEALQDVLSLLNDLSRSRMGRAILSQPACVSKLLSLLLDQRPSPKLVLIILQLCGVALPLMNTEDCEHVKLPTWGQHVHSSHWNTSQSVADPSAKIVSLLLAKLGDFLVPGDSATICSRRPSLENVSRGQYGTKNEKEKSEDSDIQGGRLSVFIHKREDQQAHEVIQPLLSSDNRPFRPGASANMERVVKMDREMTRHGKAEVTTEDAVSALKKAARWAQMGLVVSTGPPVDMAPAETPTGDKKKLAAESVCRERNADLARMDPVRPFISGHVANSMAAEVISLLHGLSTAPESSTAESWANAVQRVLTNSLACLPFLLSSLDSLNSPRTNLRHLMSMAKLANAALCALGGFQEIIKPGCRVKVTGAGIHDSVGSVVSVSEQTGTAVLQLESKDTDESPRYSDRVTVPITRLQPVRNEVYSHHHVAVTEAVVMAIKAILLPQDESMPPLQQTFPVVGDGNSLANQTYRVVAELQSRACQVLALSLRDLDFTRDFIQHCGSTIPVLKVLAKDCCHGDRLPSTQSHCTRLRLLYRDCAKPPPPPTKGDNRMNKEMTWDTNRPYPPIRACAFSCGMTAVCYLGDPNTGIGLPRGVLLYANQPIPQQAPSFYWEIEITSLGEQQEESGTVISFGFAPMAEKKDGGAWTNPIGTCLFLNNGKAVHYNGASLLQWKSTRFDVTLNVGDVAGIGWERTQEPAPQGQPAKGRVFFTYKGRKLNSWLEDVSGAMFPVVHIQKKNTRIRANFGARPFAFAEGEQHREAAEAANDLSTEMRESFEHLPFHPISDSESDSNAPPTPEHVTQSEVKVTIGPPTRTAKMPKAQTEYDPEACLHYKLFQCYDNFLSTGPDQRSSPAPQEDESDDDKEEEDAGSEDHHALLVKAWEQKVFPVIRRRFRNEAERKDGLEQIKGALQLGMTDIARQTVEFLYEENGGIPRDLHLPTIEDIKEDLAKFTIERVRKGATVVVRDTSETSSAGTTVLPKFAVRSMLKTFGLTGNVLDVDHSHELVQVESYLRSEGVLVRFWYPIDMLERPPQGMRRASITGGQILDTSNVLIHRELLQFESKMAKMYCRTALLKLIDHCNSPAMEIDSCSAGFGAGLGSGMAASAALLQQLDVENLQLLSHELLRSPQPHGTIRANSLNMTSDLRSCLAPDTCSLTQLLYSDEVKLKKELAVAIARAANQGEDYLIELTNQLCLCLQTSPDMFYYEEFLVTEAKLNLDIIFPGTACVVVSCTTDPKAAKKDTSLYKSPWARVFTYTGHRIKKSGQAAKQEVVSYPRDTNSTSNESDQYTPAIVPCDRVHLRVGVSPPPGVTLTLHALPPHFLLSVAYIETLVSEKFGCGTSSCGPRESQFDASVLGKEMHDSLWSVDNIVVTAPVFRHVIELLCRHLWFCPMPALIKEYVFHLLAQSLRLLHYCQGPHACPLPTVQPYLSPSKGMLVQLSTELVRLQQEEGKKRLSTYLQSLLEVNLALEEIQGSPESSCHPYRSPTLTVASGEAAVHKKPKVKVRKLKEKSGAVPKRTSTSPRVSESESSQSGASASSSLSGVSQETGALVGGQSEELQWFHRAHYVSQVLRYLAFKEKTAEPALVSAITDAAKVLHTPTSHNRLLVITGINPHADPQDVLQAIRASCKAGGFFSRDQIFLPLEGVAKDLPKDGSSSMEASVAEVPGSSVGKSVSSLTKVKGYAVINVLSQAKMETVAKAISKCKALQGSHDQQDVPDEILRTETVNELLLAEEAGNPALEHYLRNRLFHGEEANELCDAATLALIEIFHSCFLLEQKQGGSDQRESESGYICLGREQILQQTSENLLLTFMTSVKPLKKSLSDLVTQTLRKYGITRTPDKETSPSLDKNGKGKPSKKSPRSSKEKFVLGVVEKPVTKEKKSKPKEMPEKSEKPSKDPSASDSSVKLSKSWQQEESRFFTLDGFLQYVLECARQDIRIPWRALFACGFDINYERCSCLDPVQAQQLSSHWTQEMDAALVHYVNSFCRRLTLSPSLLHPHEIRLSEADLSNEKYAILQGLPVESLRLRFAVIQSLNGMLESSFLPLIDLRPHDTYNRSTAALLGCVRHLIFYDTKVDLMNKILNATAKRKPDQAAPEIVLDPLENLNNEEQISSNTWFCQAYRQLQSIPSSQLCVRMASGGDPTYSFNVRLTGEEVHGTSGSFRQFLWQIARELQGLPLKMLVPCLSHDRKGRYILSPGQMTFSEEKLLQFFGQMLGITIRADIPLGMDLLTCVWKLLVGLPLDPVQDLLEADQLTYSYIKKIEMCETESELIALCADVFPRFVFMSLTGGEVDLVTRGSHIPVCWENRHEYVEAIRSLRLTELSCAERVQAVLCGLATIVPLQLMSLMSPYDLEMRTCGMAYVDIDFLKAHTMYQVGLMETDTHVEYFWKALETFSQEELGRFIKFACNQERIPMTCPCKGGGADTAHVPPYPMKIAPPDGSGAPDSRYVRVETCMFMIKLPQYSSQEMMTQRLLYAISCREDPLSG